MIVHVNVTQDCIDRGIPRSHTSCPIALAIKDLLPYTVEVDYRAIRTNNRAARPCREVGLLPDEARAFIAEFDRPGPVEPFEFDVNIYEIGAA